MQHGHKKLDKSRWILLRLKFAHLRTCAFRENACAGRNMFLPAQMQQMLANEQKKT
jgi:hypothetical protein